MVDTPIGTNSPNYMLQPEDVGATVFCRVTATNASGSAQAFSNTVGPVAAAGGGDVTAPTITSSASVSNTENSVLAHSLTANETVTWSLIGGADLARFELSGSTLRWLSNGTKDFEAPNDADANNAYIVQVRATDTASNTTDQTITVTVTNVAEGGAYVGPGDVVSGAVAYWGLRAYSAAYAASGPHPAIDIRDAADTTTTTINVLTTGALDVASVPGSGGPFRVSKVYDQVGTNHLLQATHANRPTLTLNAVGTRPAFMSNGATGWTTASTVTQAQPFTVSTYLKILDTNSAAQYMVYTASIILIPENQGYAPGGGNPQMRMNAGLDITTIDAATNTWYGVQAVYNGASSNLFVNNTGDSGDAGTGGFSSTIDICSFDGGLNGPFTEIGIWPSSFIAAGLADDMYANQAAWWA